MNNRFRSLSRALLFGSMIMASYVESFWYSVYNGQQNLHPPPECIYKSLLTMGARVNSMIAWVCMKKALCRGQNISRQDVGMQYVEDWGRWYKSNGGKCIYHLGKDTHGIEALVIHVYGVHNFVPLPTLEIEASYGKYRTAKSWTGVKRRWVCFAYRAHNAWEMTMRGSWGHNCFGESCGYETRREGGQKEGNKRGNEGLMGIVWKRDMTEMEERAVGLGYHNLPRASWALSWTTCCWGIYPNGLVELAVQTGPSNPLFTHKDLYQSG